MKRLFLALLLSAFALGWAAAQETCESKTLERTANRSPVPRRRASCRSASGIPVQPEALASDGKKLSGAAKSQLHEKM